MIARQIQKESKAIGRNTIRRSRSVKSPLEISYQDLIKFVDNKVKWMEKNHAQMKINGTISNWQADHNLATGKQLLKLLKKYQREKQGDLFEMFEKMK